MNRFSPTQTEKYLTCPKLWDLSKRWTPRSGWTPGMLLGSSVHVAMAAHFRNLQAGKNREDPLNLALEYLTEHYPGSDTWTLEGLGQTVERCVKRGLVSPVISDGTVIGVEMNLGGAFLDLLHRTPQGSLVITDHKFLSRLDKKYLSDRLREADISHQLWDYVSRVESELGEVPAYFQTHLIVAAPTPFTEVHATPVTVERLRQWQAGAQVAWDSMAEGRVWSNWRVCYDKHLHYGQPCPMLRLCHDLNGDESLAGGLYESRVI